MADKPGNAALALALVGGNPDHLHPRYMAGYEAGFSAGIRAAVAVMFDKAAKRRPGAKKKAPDDRKWNDDRLVALLVDVMELKVRGHSDTAACKILSSKAMYRDRYGGIPLATLRRNLVRARNYVK